MRLLRVIGALLLASACVAAAPSIVEIILEHPVVLSEIKAQRLFDDAITWSRQHELETGGCFTIHRIIGQNIIAVDARERVVWRRKHTVAVNCPTGSSIWHTHWQPRNDTLYAGCNVQRGADPRLIDPSTPLGLVICGVGRDSVIPYTYSAAADSAWEAYLAARPDYADQLRLQEDARLRYSCADEPKASRSRPEVLICK